MLDFQSLSQIIAYIKSQEYPVTSLYYIVMAVHRLRKMVLSYVQSVIKITDDKIVTKESHHAKRFLGKESKSVSMVSSI